MDEVSAVEAVKRLGELSTSRCNRMEPKRMDRAIVVAREPSIAFYVNIAGDAKALVQSGLGIMGNQETLCRVRVIKTDERRLMCRIQEADQWQPPSF